jgi:hypothetical protein
MAMLSREMDPNRGRSGRTLLNLEALEDRCCPSGIAYNAQLHTLTLTGDATNSTFTVRDSGNGTVSATVVDGHGHQTTLSKSGVQHIAIQSGSGNDRINYTLLNRLTASEQISLNLGKGTDTVSLDFSKGVAASSLSLNVEGGQGSDQVNAVFGAIHNTHLNFATHLGTGPGQFHAALNGDLTGTANVNLSVKGNVAYDGMNVAVHGNVAASAALTIAEQGGAGKDTMHADYWGRVDGHLTVNLTGGAQFDWIESNVRLSAGSSGWVSDKILGSPGDDLLILRLYDAGTHLHARTASIDGGAGYNIAIHTPNVQLHRIQQP